eukprot:CAMPEP_0118923912 /NCGR_PEP_ID=MMETSP1169-20130426/2268_1 /TAXON_ID=36882 /ORGANISM="Pyramimonas obovata, Strain CCMP722" /LENGTH=45 /DNA_ID= /DNA_START= /DNA_END= /DNA_ORIENTATION=
MTDLFNAFITLAMFNLTHAAKRQVLILDDHKAGALDGLWAGVIAG